MRRPFRMMLAAALLSGVVGASDRRSAPRAFATVAMRTGASAPIDAPAANVAPSSSPGDPLAALDEQVRDQREAIDQLASQETELRRRLVLKGRLIQRIHNAGLLPAGGGFGQFVEHLLRVSRTQRTLEQDLSTYTKVIADRASAARSLDAILQKRADAEADQKAAVLARAAADEAENRKHAFQRAFLTSAIDDGASSSSGETVVSNDWERGAEHFRALRGRLPFPLTGRAEVRVVHRAGAGGPGVELVGSPGSAVRAVFGGRIAFADRYDPIGQLVIVDHGDHYFTVLGNLDSLDVRVGDEVSAGARVGALGRGPNGAVLYFEIRRGSSTLDPKPWLGL